MQQPYQSCCQGHTIMNALVVLLAILVTAFAVPAPFPHGKSLTYKYHAVVKVETTLSTPFASDFEIECLLQVHHDATNPTSKNIFYIILTNVKYGLYNGRMLHHAPSESVMLPIDDAAKAILNPFLVVYNEHGHLEGVQFVENEPGWSKNLKKGIASVLQLDLVQIHVQIPINVHGFTSQEVTIHGTCEVAYNVLPIDHSGSSKEFIVTKLYESKNCSRFKYYEFNHVECDECQIHEEDDMSTATKRVFVIDNYDNEILIKKLIGHSVINYLPWLAESEAHYLLTNQTMVLGDIVPVTDVHLSPLKRLIVTPIEKIIYDESKTPYVPEADMDVTHHRHVFKLDELVVKVKKMLNEAAGYLKESHIDKKQPDWKHDQTINRIFHIMGFMNVASLEKVYNEIQDAKDATEKAMKNIFLGIVPHVGTPAACLFTRNVVRTNSVPNWVAITMLANLPMHVKVPSKELLLQMEELLNLGDSVSPSVREASIFSFATLIHKTYEKEQVEIVDPLLDRYLKHFMEHVRTEPTFHMKMVYMMAMKNVRLSHVLKHLESIISGKEVVSEKPYNIRVQAIWIVKHINVGLHYTHDLLWPVLSDVSLPTVVRVAAFDGLVHQVTHLGRFMNIYWLMVNEKDEHLYNYYVDTIKGLANSVDPCLMKTREICKKVLKFISKRNVDGPLSRKIHVDYEDKKYGYAESVKASLVLDSTGFPYVGSVEHVETVTRKPIHKWGVYWNIDGMGKILKHINRNMFNEVVEAIKNDNVKSILHRAATDMPILKDINVNVIFTMNNNVVSILHSDKDNSLKILDKLKEWNKFITEHLNVINWQTVLYHNHYEMHMPTDLGVPAVLVLKVPSLTSLKGEFEYSEEKNLLILKSKLKYEQWMHGEHVMSVYNPVVDTWHSVRKTSSVDVVLPYDLSIAYNQNAKSFKVTLPRLPVSEFSIAGMSIYGKNYVTLTGDEHDLLKKFCSTCRPIHEVTITDDSLKTYDIFESKDTGTRFSVTHNCENNVVPVSPITQWLEVYLDKQMNTMSYLWMKPIMTVHHKIMNDIIVKQEKSCAVVYKIEPSISHPTSMIELNGKLSVQDLDYTHEKMDLLSNKRIDIRGSMIVKAASTDESVRRWNLNVNVMLSQGHVNNNIKVMITRITPQEEDLKICVEAQKDYPVVNSDLLKVSGKKEVNSVVTITMGHTKEDKCVHDEMDVTLTVKGEVLENQQNHIIHDSVCHKQSQNPLFYLKGTRFLMLLPSTPECIEEAIRDSSLRKYTINMTLKTVPPQLSSAVNVMHDILRVVYFPHMKYTWKHVEPEHAKIVLEFPDSSSLLNTAVVTSTHSYELVNLPFGNALWNTWMDNTLMPFSTIYDYVNKAIKFCTVNPRVLINLDNGVTPFIVSDKWTLLSGDHVEQTYSIFVKSVQNDQLALRVYIGGHELEIMPTDGSVTVTVNNKVVDKYDKGVMVPDNPESFAIRLIEANKRMVIESRMVPIQIYYLTDILTILVGTELQGQLTGLCARMDGTHKVEIPKIYSVSHL